jgi:hypothetical protein
MLDPLAYYSPETYLFATVAAIHAARVALVWLLP